MLTPARTLLRAALAGAAKEAEDAGVPREEIATDLRYLASLYGGLEPAIGPGGVGSPPGHRVLLWSATTPHTGGRRVTEGNHTT